MEYLEAFAYPFRRGNAGVMILGAVVFTFPLLLLAAVPLAGYLALALIVFLVLYYSLFLQGILESSSLGKDSFPAWPDDIAGWSLLEKTFTILAPYVVSFAPLIALRCLFADFDELGREMTGILTMFLSGPLPYAPARVPPWFEPVSWGQAVLGMLYLPMAILVWSFFGGNSILNPVAVVRSAVRTGSAYLLLVVLLAALLFAWWAIGGLLTALPAALRVVTSTLALFYVLCVSMRLIGRHYFLHRAKLGWEREE